MYISVSFCRSMYFDEDGDLAHEFYEEVVTGGSRPRTAMRRNKKNLTPQVCYIKLWVHCSVGVLNFWQQRVLWLKIKHGWPLLWWLIKIYIFTEEWFTWYWYISYVGYYEEKLRKFLFRIYYGWIDQYMLPVMMMIIVKHIYSCWRLLLFFSSLSYISFLLIAGWSTTPASSTSHGFPRSIIWNYEQLTGSPRSRNSGYEAEGGREWECVFFVVQQ